MSIWLSVYFGALFSIELQEFPNFVLFLYIIWEILNQDCEDITGKSLIVKSSMELVAIVPIITFEGYTTYLRRNKKHESLILKVKEFMCTS